MPTASLANPPQQHDRVSYLTLNRVPHLRDGLIVAKVGTGAILFTLLSLQLQAQQLLTFSTGQTLTTTVTSATTVLHLAHHRISLKRDNSVSRSAPPPTLKLIAEVPGKAVLLTDTYPSRTGGLSLCQSGEEQFLRLVTLLPAPKETFHLKVASCRDTIELADDGLQWSPTIHTLTIHWLTPPVNRPNVLTLHITPEGRLESKP